MNGSRLEALKEMVAQRPGDSFLRYGLAMEYRKNGEMGAAMEEFTALLAADPNYVPAYYHAGQTLEQSGRIDEARKLYVQGIEAATRKGDRKTRDELQAAVDLLG